MSILSRIGKYFEQKKNQMRLDIAIQELGDPKLFTPVQRKFLKSLFPTAWTHVDNMSQEDIFKIAITLKIFGYAVDTLPVFHTGLRLLQIQGIFKYDPNNPYLLCRVP